MLSGEHVTLCLGHLKVYHWITVVGSKRGVHSRDLRFEAIVVYSHK